MPNDRVIRQLTTIADATKVARWLNQQPEDYVRYFRPFPFTPGAIYDRLWSCVDDYYLGFLEEDEPFALLLLRGWDEKFEVPMFGVCVDYRYARKGWGTTCLALACSLARQRGVQKMRLKVSTENMAARKLYEKAGFVCLNPELLAGNYLYEKAL